MVALLDFFSGSRQGCVHRRTRVSITGQCPAEIKDWIGVLELANRLCRKELFVYTEVNTIRDLSNALTNGINIAESVLELLEPTKVYIYMYIYIYKDIYIYMYIYI